MDNENPFDELEEQLNPDKEIDENAKAEFEREENLIYHIFADTVEGQELLKIWVQRDLIENPLFEYGSNPCMLDVGFMQGYKHFISSIFKAIKTKKETK